MLFSGCWDVHRRARLSCRLQCIKGIGRLSQSMSHGKTKYDILHHTLSGTLPACHITVMGF